MDKIFRAMLRPAMFLGVPFESFVLLAGATFIGVIFSLNSGLAKLGFLCAGVGAGGFFMIRSVCLSDPCRLRTLMLFVLSFPRLRRCIRASGRFSISPW